MTGIALTPLGSWLLIIGLALVIVGAALIWMTGAKRADHHMHESWLRRERERQSRANVNVTVGGYPSGPRLISDLKPPPTGPGPGSRSGGQQ